MTSFVLSRDVIDYAKCDGIPMSIINIDQEKAFERVHKYFLCIIPYKIVYFNMNLFFKYVQ